MNSQTKRSALRGAAHAVVVIPGAAIEGQQLADFPVPLGFSRGPSVGTGFQWEVSGDREALLALLRYFAMTVADALHPGIPHNYLPRPEGPRLVSSATRAQLRAMCRLSTALGL